MIGMPLGMVSAGDARRGPSRQAGARLPEMCERPDDPDRARRVIDRGGATRRGAHRRRAVSAERAAIPTFSRALGGLWGAGR